MREKDIKKMMDQFSQIVDRQLNQEPFEKLISISMQVSLNELAAIVEALKPFRQRKVP